MKFPVDVRGWLTEEEGAALAELAAGAVVLEIGSYEGRSTICMAQTAKVVHAVDWHCGDDDAGWGWTLPAFLDNLKQYGVRENVVVHVARTREIASVFRDRHFDLVFVDGNHEYLYVRDDLILARRVVKDGGVIAAHDWDDERVRRAALMVLGWTGRPNAGWIKFAKAADCTSDAEAWSLPA